MFGKISLAAVLFIFGITPLSFAMKCNSPSQNKQLAQAEPVGHEHTQDDAVVQPGAKAAAEAGNKICPVSGEKINDKMKAAYEYEGRIYNFCCVACIDEFKKDPKKYIKKVEEEMQAVPAGQGQDTEKHNKADSGQHSMGHH